MNLFLYAFLLVLFAVLHALRTVHYTHMLQLNSYRSAVQNKWLMKNKAAYLKSSCLLFPAVFLPLFLKDTLVCGSILAVLFAVSICLNFPKKAKKPLVYTKRVVRLLCTNALLLILAAVLLSLLPARLAMLGFDVFSLLTPWILNLCNTLNQPMEKAINRYYINDAKKMLADHRQLITIGVTGSYGKTSVKYLLGTLLEAKYNVLITPESYNTPMGVTKTIRSSLRATHDIFVCEMGAKHIGDIRELCEIAHPMHGIITSVGPQHLESFHTLDNVKKTKFELADALPQEGLLFLNGEDENIASVAHPHPAVTYGLHDTCTYYADEITVTSSGTSFTVHHKDEAVPFTVALVGRHNVINVVGAIAVCCELGIPMHKLPVYARRIQPVAHRLQLTRRGKTTVIDDAYNSNPSGAKAALDAIALFEGQKVIITPGMIELGAVQEAENYKFGQEIAAVCDFAVLVGEKQTEPIYRGLVDAGYDREKIFVAADLNTGAEKAYAYGSPTAEKVVLFENDLPDNY